MTENTNPTPVVNPPPSAPPPRGPSLLVLAGLAVVGLVALLIGIRWSGQFKAGYQGVMRLASSKPTAETDGHDHAGHKQAYTCGMHPWVIQWKPGDCPICHMKLTPLDPAKFTATLAIDPVVTQTIGVRIAPVESGPLTSAIRTVGSVMYDETRERDVVARVAGQVTKLYANSEGKAVQKGDLLAEIDSAAVRAAGYELLNAQGAAAAIKDNSLIDATRAKLEILGVGDEDIDQILKTRTVPRTFRVRAPMSGIVLTIGGHEGHWLNEGDHIVELADLSKVWVIATLYEYQLPLVDVGQRAMMSLPYIPGQTFEGKVTYIYPYLKDDMRQVKVRLEFDNPIGLLKPGMYVSVELKSTLARDRTLVPHEAVIDTGERKVAFVSLGAGKFEPRQVKTGVESESGKIEILDGLKPGEMVVTSGQFLLDSESRLRESLAKMIKGTLASEQGAPAAEAAAPGGLVLPATVSRTLAGVLHAYFDIAEKLASDTVEGVTPAAREVAAGVDELIKSEIPGAPHFWHTHTEAATIRGKALELIDEVDISKARQKMADLSIALAKLVRATGVPAAAVGKPVEELRCPMFREGQGGGHWLQPAGEVRNPYFGKSMLGCFDRRQTLPVAKEAMP